MKKSLLSERGISQEPRANNHASIVCFLASGFWLLVAPVFSQNAPSTDAARWERQAQNVSIIRDDWGIPHVYGKTDADAVFGMIYAQAEDDFNRVETNFMTQLGRRAEAEGEGLIYQDLRAKLFNDEDLLKSYYASSPTWLRSLMNAWADGLNYYLAKHPAVKPKAIRRFEPWMALSFTEGSIGGDMERVNVNQLQAFYGRTPASQLPPEPPVLDEPGGSNGIAVAPANTTGKRALLLINPHTSFFFRSELQMVSEEGLNAYGAATWGQFFLYQGFNDRVGWMHTSSAVDNTDEFLETVTKKGEGYVYQYGSEERPVSTREITVSYKTASGAMDTKKFTTYRTHHGPIVRELTGKWVAFALMNEPVKALTQSYSRTKARDYKSYVELMNLHTNSSNNTLFATADGDIAYFHGNFIPRRDPGFDYTRPVDGSNPATDWKGVLSFDETPNLKNPASGFLYNANDWPWAAAGSSSLKQSAFPKYVDNGNESARGRHAVMVLENRKDFTLESLMKAAYDSYLPWFEKPLPALVAAYDALPSTDPMKSKLAEPIKLLRAWNKRWDVTSVETSLAVFWGTEVQRGGGRGGAENAPPDQLLRALAAACDKLTADFGNWKTPWGDINRFQRLTGDIVQPFNDAGRSIPVGFTAGTWGSLASFSARAYNGTKKWYGTSGNSFVAVVEFGPTVRARAVTAGGASGDPASLHFNDQADRYATGNLRDVYFYKEQLKGHTQREYHPGQ
jgi:acyl-homoserine lactone acylase PvdQ